MKSKIILTFFMAVISGLSAQNQFENLKKYWCYRDRLRRDFVVVDQNVERFGVNIPASDINITENRIEWGDANNGMSHYLSVLSTELWLLKNNNQGYSLTLKELYYAMLAMERMDLYSESSWREQHGKPVFVNPGIDINGCHTRDDVSDGFWNQYKSHFKVDNFRSVFELDSHLRRQEISQDNIFHNLEGLALIASLVGSENVASIPVTFVNPYINNYLSSKGIKNGSIINFSLWAKDYTKRYIRFMQSGSESWKIKVLGKTIASITNNWILANPVTGQPVKEGSGEDFDTGIFYNAGIIAAGKAITGENLRTQDAFIVSNNKSNAIFGTLFRSGGQVKVPWPFPFNKIKSPITFKKRFLDRYKVSTLALNGNFLGDETFPVLRNNQARIPEQPYEHFPLFYEVLRDPSRRLMLANSTAYMQDRDNIEGLLNEAPPEGPKSNTVHAFSHSSRCVWPERLGQNVDKNIEYSGLDYMMLHNLYYIAFKLTNFDPINIPSIWPESNAYQNGTFIGTDIVSSNTVAETSNLCLVAKESITLSDGFISQLGSKFTANVSEDDDLRIYRTISEDCSNFKSKINGRIVNQRSSNNEVYQVVYQAVDTSSIVRPHIIINIEVDDPSILDTNNISTRSERYKILKIDTIISPSVEIIEGKTNVPDKVFFTPNPTSNKVQLYGVDFSGSSVLVDILNLHGQKVDSHILFDNDRTINLDKLPNGMYLFKVYFKQEVFTSKIIIRQRL